MVRGNAYGGEFLNCSWTDSSRWIVQYRFSQQPMRILLYYKHNAGVIRREGVAGRGMDVRRGPAHACVALGARGRVLVSPCHASSSSDSAPRADSSPSSVTMEYQRKQAKAMQAYLRERSLEKTIADAQVFGWTRKNEINNGRWVMMGLAVGLLTEYATGVDFIDQLKLMVSYLGIIDVE